MNGHTIFWITQIILLIILASILLTPYDRDIKDYFEEQEKEGDK
jgi:hypothetical protein